jgi:hypothetical protein
MLNLDAVLMDDGYWKEPEVFRPERHLNEDGTKVIKSDHFYPFGIGINQRNNSLLRSKTNNKSLQIICREKDVFGRFLGKKYLFSLHGCFDQKVSI